VIAITHNLGGGAMLRCSLCGKVFEKNVASDAQKHLSHHAGIYAKLEKVDMNLGNSIKYS